MKIATRWYDKKKPIFYKSSRTSFSQIVTFLYRPKCRPIFGQLLWENLSKRFFLISPICSRWQRNSFGIILTWLWFIYRFVNNQNIDIPLLFAFFWFMCNVTNSILILRCRPWFYVGCCCPSRESICYIFMIQTGLTSNRYWWLCQIVCLKLHFKPT